jgi:hypothetical protein
LRHREHNDWRIFGMRSTFSVYLTNGVVVDALPRGPASVSESARRRGTGAPAYQWRPTVRSRGKPRHRCPRAGRLAELQVCAARHVPNRAQEKLEVEPHRPVSNVQIVDSHHLLHRDSDSQDLPRTGHSRG